MSRSNANAEKLRDRDARLGFRVDAQTKRLVERAVRLERRTLTDYCLNALTEAAQRTIQEHESLVLSEADRVAFFDALMRPRAPNARLKRAMQASNKAFK